MWALAKVPRHLLNLGVAVLWGPPWLLGRPGLSKAALGPGVRTGALGHVQVAPHWLLLVGDMVVLCHQQSGGHCRRGLPSSLPTPACPQPFLSLGVWTAVVSVRSVSRCTPHWRCGVCWVPRGHRGKGGAPLRFLAPWASCGPPRAVGKLAVVAGVRSRHHLAGVHSLPCRSPQVVTRPTLQSCTASELVSLALLFKVCSCGLVPWCSGLSLWLLPWDQLGCHRYSPSGE